LTRICMDTSAYSRFRGGHLAAVREMTSAREIGVPAVVLGELRTGFALGKRRERNERELAVFLSEPVCSVLEVDGDAASIYAEIVVELRRAGTPLPTNDIWIAALAARDGLTVLTFDRHFERIGRVGKRILD
jgi:tRNA(fMet)-specific endonuclease VapC